MTETEQETTKEPAVADVMSVS